MSQYAKEFIVASSFPALLIPYTAAMRSTSKKYSYESYTMIGPVFFGLFAVISLAIAPELPRFERGAYTALVSSSVALIYSHFMKTYDFKNNQDRARYYITVLVMHMIVLALVIPGLFYLMEET